MTLKQQQKHLRRRAALVAAPTSLPADMMASRIASALQSHQAGDLPTAEAVYSEVLRLHPGHPDALHYLGMVHYQRRQLTQAAELMERSIAAAGRQGGGRAAFHSNYGLVLHDQGKLNDAAAAYERALQLRPDHPEALNNYGNTLQALEKLEEALLRYRRAMELQPSYVQAYCNAGAVLKKLERLGEAEEAYRAALRFDPKNAQAHYNLGNTLGELGRLEEASEHYLRALAEDPNHPKAQINLGNVLTDMGKVEEAMTRYEAALRLDPESGDARYNLGNSLYAQDRLDEAGALYASVGDGEPISSKTCVNWGAVLETQGKVAEAVSLYEKAAALFDDAAGNAPKEENVVAHMNLAMARLVMGDLAGGLAHYEWRHRSELAERSRAHSGPMWRGEPLEGKTILLHWEQGLGDTLHFLRYAPMVRERGGQVILEVQPCLQRLAEAMGSEFAVLGESQPAPPYDFQCPLMSLPFVFGTRLDTIPAGVPYLRVPEAEMAYAGTLPWAAGLKVGLVWAGSPGHAKDKLRSLKLEQLASLLAIPGIQFYSLQVGPAVEQLASFPAVWNLSPDPGNMADTAAKLAYLDLLIAADTSMVHLAGALGKPVWVMLPHTPDWRWLRERGDSPWYPTMRLFRQPERHDWRSVVERVAEALRERAAAPAAPAAKIGYPDAHGSPL